MRGTSVKIDNIAPVLLMICVLIAACGIAGCSEEKSKTSFMTGSGITDNTPRDIEKRSSFDEALTALRTYEPGTGNKSIPVNIYYIRGSSIDSSGLAKEWIFGVKRGTEQVFTIYNNMGITQIPWQKSIQYSEIVPDKIVKPADLIKSHKLMISDLQYPYVDELELSNGVYTFTNNSGTTSKSFKFDAATGTTLN
jgi:hypothetical protein